MNRVYICVLLCVFRGTSGEDQRGCISNSAFNGGGFPETADGMKCAAVKLEENHDVDQIGSAAS